MFKISEAERLSILTSLSMGLVPGVGLSHLAVARELETRAICHDIDSVAAGGSAFRFIKGELGYGKSFLLSLARHEARKKNLVVAHAEFGRNQRLQGSDGSARAFYAELMSKLFTRTSNEPGALRRVIEGWIASVMNAVKEAGGDDAQIKAQIVSRLRPLRDHENGHAFAYVLTKYYEGYVTDDQHTQDAALRWLRAEYSTKSEARASLGIHTIIRDEDIYTAMKIFAGFCRIAGYGGLHIIVDELSSLTERLINKNAREANFSTLLKMINESAQGGSPGLGFLIAGTNSAMEDQDKGLFSYLPLRSRLESKGNSVTRFSPVVSLQPLGREHIYELLRKIVVIHAGGNIEKEAIPEDGILFYLEQQLAHHSTKAINARDLVRPFVELLVTMEDTPGKKWQEFFVRGASTAK